VQAVPAPEPQPAPEPEPAPEPGPKQACLGLVLAALSEGAQQRPGSEPEPEPGPEPEPELTPKPGPMRFDTAAEVVVSVVQRAHEAATHIQAMHRGASPEKSGRPRRGTWRRWHSDRIGWRLGRAAGTRVGGSNG
jgi:hypothetical protein